MTALPAQRMRTVRAPEIRRLECASGIPPLGNDAPVFNNDAHGSTGSPAAGAMIDAFLRTGGSIQQFCTGTCDPD